MSYQNNMLYVLCHYISYQNKTLFNPEQHSIQSHTVSNTKDTANSQKRKELAYIIGDSMIKNLEGHRMSRRKFRKTHSISGAKSEDAIHYVKPILTRNPDEIIIHFGTNVIASKYKKIENYRKINNKFKHSSQRTRISISSIIMRGDNDQMKKDIQIMNDELYKLCREYKLDFINNNI